MSLYTRIGCTVILVVLGCLSGVCQRDVGLPLSADSLRMVIRFKTPVPEGRVLKVNDIMIHHYTTDIDNPKSYTTKNSAKKILQDPEFDLKKPTVFYAHGYLELVTDESVRYVTDSYIQHGGYNVLILDYANLVYGDYLSACLHVNEVASAVSEFLSQLLGGGLPVETLHLVGHSMGVHVLGHVARVQGRRGFKIRRLTGLDPAYPLFYPPFVINTPVSTKDADFVDIIHTDAGSYGVPASIGHVDFWPNGGIAAQPGCEGGTILFTTEDFCSHWRSWAFWAESVRNEPFLARRCRNYDKFLRGKCRNNSLVHMGPDTDITLRGNFYLRTAAQSPYALGETGAQ